jgi:hypothetical protein
MYESFYGLNMDPFRLNADHRFCSKDRPHAADIVKEPPKGVNHQRRGH